MIKANKLQQYRQHLETMLRDISIQNTLGEPGQKTVTLDQQSIGRLSRMDAMQQQAMAKATQNRRDIMQRRILAAMDRLDTQEFGYCSQCGNDIPQKRLDLDPTAFICVSCASD